MPSRRVMVDHITVGVSDLERYGAFVLDPDGHNVEAVYHALAE